MIPQRSILCMEILSENTRIPEESHIYKRICWINSRRPQRGSYLQLLKMRSRRDRHPPQAIIFYKYMIPQGSIICQKILSENITIPEESHIYKRSCWINSRRPQRGSNYLLNFLQITIINHFVDKNFNSTSIYITSRRLKGVISMYKYAES